MRSAFQSVIQPESVSDKNKLIGDAESKKAHHATANHCLCNMVIFTNENYFRKLFSKKAACT